MISLSFGTGTMPPARRMVFWALLSLNSLIAVSGYLLSSVTINFCAVGIGLFWGSGRVPWRFLMGVSVILSFLNLGKFAMRDKYWSHDEDAPPPTTGFADLPSRYLEWVQASIDATNGGGVAVEDAMGRVTLNNDTHQTMADRIDNLQNLIFVIDAEDSLHIEPLYGKSYEMIPALLIPRILWPDKPRTHEGQVLLNVHFGRQDLNSTFKTYIAWGILPEAYGNFGPMTGSVLLGVVVGLFCAWIEMQTARKLAISLEGIVGFGLILNMMNSFEMVASVLVTSSFQNLVPIVLAFMPFVRRRTILRENANSYPA
jgi:hypothetical protein